MIFASFLKPFDFPTFVIFCWILWNLLLLEDRLRSLYGVRSLEIISAIYGWANIAISRYSNNTRDAGYDGRWLTPRNPRYVKVLVARAFPRPRHLALNSETRAHSPSVPNTRFILINSMRWWKVKLSFIQVSKLLYLVIYNKIIVDRLL